MHNVRKYCHSFIFKTRPQLLAEPERTVITELLHSLSKTFVFLLDFFRGFFILK